MEDRLILPTKIPLPAIEQARRRIGDLVLRTPLVRLNRKSLQREIWLKLENLQPICSFKIRGAGNAIRALEATALDRGVFTASAGNMAQGVAYVAQQLGLEAKAVVPDHAPKTKLDAITEYGAEVVKVPFDEWWSVLVSHRFPELDGHFIHPFADIDVIAGNGTIGLEILEDLPEVETIIVPFGGGGLSCGIASAVRALKPGVRVIASEVASAAPLAAALARGEPCPTSYSPSFVDGIGGKSILSEMWPLVSSLIDDSLVVSLQQIAEAIETLARRNHVIAEGAGASSVAAALAGQDLKGPIVCIVSGGNIDADTLATILSGRVPV